MSMWGRLEAEIEAEALKLIKRFEKYARRTRDEDVRRQRRSIMALPSSPISRPTYWSVDRGFDPYWVRSRASNYAHALTQRMKSGSYEPLAPYERLIPKGTGGRFRSVSVYQVPDAAVSLNLYRSLLRKNLPRFSANSYAYRKDRSGFDAIERMRFDMSGRGRVYVAEYDFSKFFDTISHEFLYRSLRDGQYLITPLELNLLRAFLEGWQPTTPYVSRGGERRAVGLPQGTSLSLFLANVAASPIDRAFERIGVGFVRFADDTVIFDADYGRVSAAVDALHELSDTMGVSINQEKSEGIRLLLPGENAKGEIRSTTSLDFLGHNLAADRLSLRDEVVSRFKARIQRLIYDNLLREPVAGNLDPDRFGSFDKDYLVYVQQLRRYIYGNLSELEVRRFQAGAVPRRRFIGLMSNFPLVDDSLQLGALDKWVLDQTWLALRKRAQLEVVAKSTPPHGQSQSRLRVFHGRSSTGDLIDMRLPSLARISGVLNKAARLYGTGAVSGSGGMDYSYAE